MTHQLVGTWAVQLIVGGLLVANPLYKDVEQWVKLCRST